MVSANRQLSSWSIAVALAGIPRLFSTLLLLPLVLSLGLMYVQLLVTGLLLRTSVQNPQDIQSSIQRLEDDNIGRRLLYGDGRRRPPLQVCRWKNVVAKDGSTTEIPPSSDCAPDLLDVAIHTKLIDTFDIEPYRRQFDGNIDRLHICAECKPHVVIYGDDALFHTEVRSVWGLVVLSLTQFGPRNERYLLALEDMKEIRNIFGPITLYLQGVSSPIDLQKARTLLALIINIAGLTIIATWLAIKAHRKVLDYFAYSGALSPLVAATGKSTFYSALWILTIFRVGTFLLASVPLVVFGLGQLLDHQDLTTLWQQQRLLLLLWLPALVLSLATATLVASVADLKRRHGLLSFVYRYAPLFAATSGLLIWGISFIFDSSTAALVRMFIVSTPIVGMGPILVAPIVGPPIVSLIVHTVATLSMCIIILRHNARWFAAHLEDL